MDYKKVTQKIDTVNCRPKVFACTYKKSCITKNNTSPISPFIEMCAFYSMRKFWNEMCMNSQNKLTFLSCNVY